MITIIAISIYVIGYIVSLPAFGFKLIEYFRSYESPTLSDYTFSGILAIFASFSWPIIWVTSEIVKRFNDD